MAAAAISPAVSMAAAPAMKVATVLARRRRIPPDLYLRMMTEGPRVKASEPMMLCWDKEDAPPTGTQKP